MVDQLDKSQSCLGRWQGFTRCLVELSSGPRVAWMEDQPQSGRGQNTHFHFR